MLGHGCAKCENLAANAREAADELGLEYTLEKVTGLIELHSFGVMTTPALVVAGEVMMVAKAANARPGKELLQ